MIFGAEIQLASKVVVAPRVGFPPQKSFHILKLPSGDIAGADEEMARLES